MQPKFGGTIFFGSQEQRPQNRCRLQAKYLPEYKILISNDLIGWYVAEMLYCLAQWRRRKMALFAIFLQWKQTNCVYFPRDYNRGCVNPVAAQKTQHVWRWFNNFLTYWQTDNQMENRRQVIGGLSALWDCLASSTIWQTEWTWNWWIYTRLIHVARGSCVHRWAEEAE